MKRNTVVVGGGPAGVIAAIGARRQDPEANVMLVSEEAGEPYEKPPLSKAVLLRKAEPHDAPIAGPGGLAALGVEALRGVRCEAIDRTAREIVTSAGRMPYDALVLATGSVVREVPALPAGLPGVHYLRSAADALGLREALGNGGDVLVVGAGLIGLEVAASAAEIGLKVTVIDAAPRVMMRACDAETGVQVLAAHLARGVTVRLETGVAAAAAVAGGKLAIQTTAGDTIVADIVVVGVGVRPNVALAAAAGLAVEDGILVDEYCRTSDPAILAAGDCARFPGPDGPARLENWKHAMDHGEIAGRNAAGAKETYRAVPSYWSEQYDLYIQGVGWQAAGLPESGATTVRRSLAGSGAIVFEMKNGLVSHALGINATRDISAARRMIERGIRVDPAALADPERPLAALLKAVA